MKIKSDLKEIYNEVSTQFSNTRKKFWHEFELIKLEIEKFLKNNEKVKILELGCGDGRLYTFLSEKFGKSKIDYIGVDFSDKLIGIAKKNNPNQTFVVDDMTHFVEKQDQQLYDFVIAVASFQHIPTRKERFILLKNIYRILNYDGKIVLINWSFSKWFLKKYKKALLKSLGLFLITFGNKKINDVFIHRKTRGKTSYRYYHIFFLFELRKLTKFGGFVLENISFVNSKGNLTNDWRNSRNSFYVGKKTI